MSGKGLDFPNSGEFCDHWVDFFSRSAGLTLFRTAIRRAGTLPGSPFRGPPSDHACAVPAGAEPAVQALLATPSGLSLRSRLRLLNQRLDLAAFHALFQELLAPVVDPLRAGRDPGRESRRVAL